MNIRALVPALPYLAVVTVAALVGFSITRVDAGAAEHQVSFTVAGALIAAVAIAIARAFSSKSSRPFPGIPERKFLGLKVGVVAFCIAVSGWLVAVLINRSVGFALVVVGVIVGCVGIAIHFVLMFSSHE